MKFAYPASLACQVRSAIRFRDELPYQDMASILKKELPYRPELHRKYFLSFFEECSPRLIKKFMAEQDISREQVLAMFDALPEQGEKMDFTEAIRNGEF